MGQLLLLRYTAEKILTNTCSCPRSIGLLSSCYHYGHIAYVGGAMGGSGLHNILELAAGLPVLVGKNYHQFLKQLILSKGGVISILQKQMLQNI